MVDDIIDYIYQVKPYHVQFEQFIEKYTSEQEDANVSIEEENDITMRIRFDAVTQEVDKQGDMSDLAFMETHMANRLWLLKHKVFTNDSEMKAYIEDVLSAHFKGITVDGYEFDIEKAGYDAFLYDEKLYDAPTMSDEYCFVDFTERLPYKYVKNFIKVGVETLQIHTDEEILTGNCTCTWEFNGESGVIDDFSISANMVSINRPIRQYEKITVLNTVKKVRTAYIFVGHPFMEFEDPDESNRRMFAQVGTREFDIPDSDIGTQKVTVYVIHPNGSKRPTLNYSRIGPHITLNEDLKENYRLQLVTIDYSKIYDKLYTWEDIYGQSNNVTTLEGSGLLRPHHEIDRPEELTVIYPISDLMVYSQEKSVKSIVNMNWKNDHYRVPVSSNLVTKLAKDINLGDKTILVESGKKLRKPYVTDDNKIVPGRIIVDSELIEYHEYSENDEGQGVLGGIRRAAQGTVLLVDGHKAGNPVYVYNDKTLKDLSPRTVYISTEFREGMENKFTIPSDFKYASNITVQKKPLINLMTDISFEYDVFYIDSNNVKLPTETEQGYLFVNGDKITFNNIEPYQERYYRIGGFNIYKLYSKDDAIICSFNPITLDPSEYEIVVKTAADTKIYEDEGGKYPYHIDYKDAYVVLKEPPKPFEVIIVGNVI